MDIDRPLGAVVGDFHGRSRWAAALPRCDATEDSRMPRQVQLLLNVPVVDHRQDLILSLNHYQPYN